MSIISAVYVPEGIAMAADSRITGYKNYSNGLTDRFAISDNAQKLFLLSKVKIGISYCGNTQIDNKSIADFIRNFEITQIQSSDDIIQISHKLSAYLKSFPDGNGTYFFLAGYINDDAYIYEISSENVICHASEINYTTIWSGERDAITRLLNSQPSVSLNLGLMPLKDAVDFAEFLVEVTIKYQRFEDRVATCGGPIDILVLTKDTAKFVRHKIFNPGRLSDA